MHLYSYFFVCLFYPNSGRGLPSRGFVISLIGYVTLCRTPLEERHSQETDIHASGGIRTHNPSKRAAQTNALGRGTTGTGMAKVKVD
jgi:hypothetical protein